MSRTIKFGRSCGHIRVLPMCCGAIPSSMQLYFENGWPVSGVAMLTHGLRISCANFSCALEQLAARKEMLRKCPSRRPHLQMRSAFQQCI
jgi:hypothetical protein